MTANKHWFISRNDAAKKLALTDDVFKFLRNYEIENMLNKRHKHNYVVNELCPFNGIYCEYGRIKRITQ